MAIKLIVGLLVLQMLVSATEASSVTKSDGADLLSGFRELEAHLKENVNSGDVAGALAAAKELLVPCGDKACLGALMKLTENNLQRAARVFVHLIEVATKPEEKCTQQTVDHLADVFVAYTFRLDNRRRILMRVDEVLTPLLASLRSKCDTYFADKFEQQLNKLKPKVKSKVYELFNDEALKRLPEVNNDLIYIDSAFAKKVDFNNYMAHLKSENRKKFIDYYMEFYDKNIREPCLKFRHHFYELAEDFTESEKLFDMYKVSGDRPAELLKGMERHRLCSIAAIEKHYYLVKVEASRIFMDYESDASWKRVNFNSQEPRGSEGPRMY